MRLRFVLPFALGCLATACGGSKGLVIQEDLCDGGTQTFTAVAQGDGGTVIVQQQCGSATTTTILSAPCVTPEDGGVPVATFTLPESFNPQHGDTLSASFCSPMCGDAGELCQQVGVSQIIDDSLAHTVPAGGTTIEVACVGVIDRCLGETAYLQLVQ